MKEYIFSLSNGYAVGNDFTATLQDAISICLKTSNGMNTMNWLHAKVGGKCINVGYSVKIGFKEWDFYQYKNINL